MKLKRLLLLLLPSLIACSSIKDQQSQNQQGPNHKIAKYVPFKKIKGDTVAYILKNFIDRKAKYEGKTLNNMLKDLELPIGYYVLDIPDHQNMINTTMLYFFNHNERDMKIASGRAVNIIVTWKEPIPEKIPWELSPKNHGQWTIDEKNFYGERIIDKIFTTDWETKKP